VSAGRYIDTRGHLEAWFASMLGTETSENINKYFKDFSRKVINPPKYVSLDWTKSQELLLEVSQMLEFQELEKFLGLAGNIFSDLVKVFFTNLKVKEDRIESRVKRVTMKMMEQLAPEGGVEWSLNSICYK